MTDPKFVAEWSLDTPIEWQREGRERLNAVIQRYNAWMRGAMVDGTCDARVAREVLAHVEEGLQTWATRDGGDAWREVLGEVRREVLARMRGQDEEDEEDQ